MNSKTSDTGFRTVVLLLAAPETDALSGEDGWAEFGGGTSLTEKLDSDELDIL
jgi:hypothetical protein